MPPLDTAALMKKLQSGKGIGAILLLGTDSYLREECRARIIERFVPQGARDWGVTRFAARDTDAEEVIGKALSMPMLAPAQVVVVDGVEAWQRGGEDDEAPAKKAAKEKGAAEILAEYLENPAPFTVLVLEATALDQRFKLFKALSEGALVVSTNLSDAKDEDTRRSDSIAACRDLLPKVAAELGVTLDPAAADDLTAATNGSLAQARTELQKLALYAGERKRISAEDVEKLVVSARQYSVWQFATILAQRNRQQALVFLNSLMSEGEDAVAIIGAMSWMYRALLGVQELPRGTGAGQAAGRLRMRYDTAEMALREAPRIPRERLVAGLHALAEADNRLKGGNPDESALMEFLAAELTA